MKAPTVFTQRSLGWQVCVFVTHSFTSGDQKGKHALLSTVPLFSIQVHTLSETKPDKQHGKVMAMQCVFGSLTHCSIFIKIKKADGTSTHRHNTQTYTDLQTSQIKWWPFCLSHPPYGSGVGSVLTLWLWPEIFVWVDLLKILNVDMAADTWFKTRPGKGA